ADAQASRAKLRATHCTHALTLDVLSFSASAPGDGLGLRWLEFYFVGIYLARRQNLRPLMVLLCRRRAVSRACTPASQRHPGSTLERGSAHIGHTEVVPRP